MKTYKKFIAALAAILMLLTLLPSAVFAAGFPKHQNYIADEAGILTEDVINAIRDMNKTLAGDLQLTIAVCTVNTIGDSDIAEYARDLFKEWKLGEGVLILIAKEDGNYYLVPSTGVEDILTNEELAGIRDEHFEEDFSNGSYPRAVHKVALKLKTTLVAGFQARAAEKAAAADTTEESGESEENKGTTVGGVIVGFFKVLLWLAVIAIVLFVGLFVWAMFNDDVAALFQKYLFRRNSGTRSNIPQHTYDDRLYGGRPSNAQRRPGQNQGRPNQNGYYGQQAGYLPDGRNNYGGQGYPQPMPQNYSNRGGYPAQGQYRPQQNPNQYNGYGQQQRPQQTPYSTPTMNPNYSGYPGQQNGYSGNGGQPQGYPQNPQNPYGQYSGQQPQQNYGNRPGYGAQQQNASDATVQFNIPRRN